MCLTFQREGGQRVTAKRTAWATDYHRQRERERVRLFKTATNHTTDEQEAGMSVCLYTHMYYTALHQHQGHILNSQLHGAVERKQQ